MARNTLGFDAGSLKLASPAQSLAPIKGIPGFTNGKKRSGISPPSYTITSAASINEGSALTINVGGSNIVNDTYYFTINHITSVSGDFSASSGSFSISGNAGSFTITPTADSSTEGAETFTVSIRSGSTSGTILATSSSITINDTSTAPSVGTATFYTPLVNQLYGGASGTVGSAAFSVTSGWMKFDNPGGDWSAEITVGAGWGNASGHVGAVNQAFWNANPGFGQGTGDGAFWYLGYSFSYGDSSGTSASFNGSEYSTLPTSGQTVGLVYNSTNGKLRIYRNGTLVVTFTLSAGGTLYPAIGYWTGTIAGTWNSTTSAYFSSYVYPT